MKYCKNCGQPVDETAKFCEKCGKPLIDEMVDSKQIKQTSLKKKNKRVQILAGVIFGIIAIVIIIKFGTITDPLDKTGNNNDEVDYLQLNEKGTLDDWDIEIVACFIESYVVFHGKGVYELDAGVGNKYLVVHYSVKNNSTSPAYFNSQSSWVNDYYISLGYKTDITYTAQLSSNNDDVFNKQIQPLATAYGFVYFKIPDDVAIDLENFVLKVSYNKKNTNRQIFWKFDPEMMFEPRKQGDISHYDIP